MWNKFICILKSRSGISMQKILRFLWRNFGTLGIFFMISDKFTKYFLLKKVLWFFWNLAHFKFIQSSCKIFFLYFKLPANENFPMGSNIYFKFQIFGSKSQKVKKSDRILVEQAPPHTSPPHTDAHAHTNTSPPPLPPPPQKKKTRQIR